MLSEGTQSVEARICARLNSLDALLALGVLLAQSVADTWLAQSVAETMLAAVAPPPVSGAV
jgi:hypothetical protein